MSKGVGVTMAGSSWPNVKAGMAGGISLRAEQGAQGIRKRVSNAAYNLADDEWRRKLQ